MKANFALSLSFDGIKLLHRAAGGWRRVGEVALDVPDLPAALADLRAKAEARAPDGIATKLIIPEGQIKYLTIDTGDLDSEARRAAAEAALDGATPYDVADLAFDTAPDGDQTHIAAVAHETLAEAEGFAEQNGFNPIFTVAVPGDAPFIGEPFFGPTAFAATLLAPGETVEPDGIAVVELSGLPEDGPAAEVVASEPEETGTWEEEAPGDDTAPAPDLPDAPPAEVESVETAAEPETASEALSPIEEPTIDTDEPAPEQAPTPDEASEDEEAEPEPDLTPPDDAPTPDDVDSALEPEPETALAPSEAEDAEADDTPPGRRFALRATEADRDPEPSSDASTAPAPPVAGFSSRRSGAPVPGPSSLPSLGGVTRDPDAVPLRPEGAQIVAASIPGLDDERPDTRRAPTDPAPAVRDEDTPLDLTTPQAAAETLLKSPPDVTHEDEDDVFLASAAPAVATSDAVPEPAPPRGFLSRRRKQASPVPVPPADASAEAKAAARAARASEKQRLTIFGARKPATNEGPVIGGKPRFLGLALTVALLVFMAVVAVWAALFLEDGLAGLFERPETEQVGAIDAAELEQEPEPIDEAAEDAVTTASLDPDDVLASAPPPVFLDPAPAPAAQPAFDLDAAAEFYAVTGIWTVPPDVPGPPRSVPLDNLYQTSIDPARLSLDAVALPAPRNAAREDLRPSQGVPAPRGTQFDFDSRGLIVPTPDGAISPDGFTVFRGTPPARPPERPAPPENAEPDVEDEASLANPALAQARPRARPDGLIENAERRSFGGISRAELAEMRPRLRPRTEKDAQEEADQTPTEFATTSSQRPGARPNNFAQIVAQARERQQAARAAAPEPTETAAVAPRTVAPSIPSRASVTRQATLNNAINLRKMNLMGVYGKPSDRRALVRLANGRYRKVQVGDRLDGGRVSAIGESELRYQKNGRNISLKMPRS